MPTINILVKNKVAQQTNKEVYVCGNSDFTIVFDFDTEWESHTAKTARFRYNGSYQEVMFTGNECPVPIISNTNNIQIGVYAGDLHTTTAASIMARKSILCGDGTHDEPPEDVYNQLLDAINNGLVKGDKGEKGDPFTYDDFTEEQLEALKGEDGYTPVKGVDYFDGQDGYTPVKGVDYFDGVDGKDGADGKTPVKGVDYFDGQDGSDGKDGSDGVSVTHSWSGTTLTVTSASGTSSADLKGERGTDGYTPVKGVDYEDGKDGYTPQKNVDYFDGIDGKDGVSPTIAVNDVTGGHKLTITDADGTRTVDVMDGEDGASGVHIGSDTPPDNANVWVDTSGEPSSTEAWTFTLEDGTTVEKTVVVVS